MPTNLQKEAARPRRYRRPARHLAADVDHRRGGHQPLPQPGALQRDRVRRRAGSRHPGARGAGQARNSGIRPGRGQTAGPARLRRHRAAHHPRRSSRCRNAAEDRGQQLGAGRSGSRRGDDRAGRRARRRSGLVLQGHQGRRPSPAVPADEGRGDRGQGLLTRLPPRAGGQGRGPGPRVGAGARPGPAGPGDDRGAAERGRRRPGRRGLQRHVPDQRGTAADRLPGSPGAGQAAAITRSGRAGSPGPWSSGPP
jgi:hypothetical protein